MHYHRVGYDEADSGLAERIAVVCFYDYAYPRHGFALLGQPKTCS